jgi:hypothetical protein
LFASIFLKVNGSLCDRGNGNLIVVPNAIATASHLTRNWGEPFRVLAAEDHNRDKMAVTNNGATCTLASRLVIWTYLKGFATSKTVYAMMA